MFHLGNNYLGCEDLESDPFANLALQRFTCWLYYRFSSFLASLSLGLITSRNYLSKLGIKNGGTNGTTNLMSEQLTTLTKYEGLGSAMVAELTISFWSGIGVILAVKMVDSLDYCVEALMRRKQCYC